MSFEILAGLSSEWVGLLPETMIVDGPGQLLRMARSQTTTASLTTSSALPALAACAAR